MCPIAYAMVSTVRPKANETPSRPIPTCGNEAAITAEPHPPKVSQNVPIASAAYFCVFISPPCQSWLVKHPLSRQRGPYHHRHQSESPSAGITISRGEATLRGLDAEF